MHIDACELSLVWESGKIFSTKKVPKKTVKQVRRAWFKSLICLRNFIKSFPNFETVFDKIISPKKNYIFILKKLIKIFQVFSVLTTDEWNIYLNIFNIVPQNTGETGPQNDFFFGITIIIVVFSTKKNLFISNIYWILLNNLNLNIIFI
jgi:hypothetical protein